MARRPALSLIGALALCAVLIAPPVLADVEDLSSDDLCDLLPQDRGLVFTAADLATGPSCQRSEGICSPDGVNEQPPAWSP